MKKKILFRADGNSETGLGHMYRLFALVEMLKDEYDFNFVSRKATMISIVPPSYNMVLVPDTVPVSEEPDWLAQNFPPETYIIIADGYPFGSRYQNKVKRMGFLLVYIDDLANDWMFADCVINHSPGFKKSDYKAQPSTKFGLGPDFAVLRPQFLSCAKTTKKAGKIDTVFVCFGGSDAQNLSYKWVQAILKFNEIKKVHVILGGAYAHNDIFEVTKNHASKVFLHRNLSAKRMIEVMERCNFAIVPTSTVCYEVCSVKMLILGGYYVDNQKHIYNGLLRKKVIIDGGNFEAYRTTDFDKIIGKILNMSIPEINGYIDRQQQMIDGNSGKRIVQLVEDLSKVPEISFRKATTNDAELIFEWANDRQVRLNAINKDPIIWEKHIEWYKSTINDESSIILILHLGNTPIGQIRYQKEADNYVIDYSIDKEYRGMGYGSKMVKQSLEIIGDKNGEMDVVAKVATNNIASAKVFEKLGFSHVDHEVHNGSAYSVFQYSKQRL